MLELCTQAQAMLGVLKLSRMTTFLSVRPPLNVTISETTLTVVCADGALVRVLQGANALLEALLAAASAAAEGWTARCAWVDTLLRVRAGALIICVTSLSCALLWPRAAADVPLRSAVCDAGARGARRRADSGRRGRVIIRAAAAAARVWRRIV
jgi:hypothetical protein